MPRLYSVSEERRLSERNFACVICTERWPESMMKIQDGVDSDRRCLNDYAPNGGTLARDLDRAAASERSARLTEQYAEGPKYPGWFDDTEDVVVLTTFSPEPRTLTRGGASAELTINGTGLATTDTIEYGHAGITDASAAVLTLVTYDSDGNALTPFVDVLVLTVQASSAVPLGSHDLTYNDVLYRNVFDVRA